MFDTTTRYEVICSATGAITLSVFGTATQLTAMFGGTGGNTMGTGNIVDLLMARLPGNGNIADKLMASLTGTNAGTTQVVMQALPGALASTTPVLGVVGTPIVDTSVTADNCCIFDTNPAGGTGLIGTLSIAITAGVGFTVSSTDSGDNGTNVQVWVLDPSWTTLLQAAGLTTGA